MPTFSSQLCKVEWDHLCGRPLRWLPSEIQWTERPASPSVILPVLGNVQKHHFRRECLLRWVLRIAMLATHSLGWFLFSWDPQGMENKVTDCCIRLHPASSKNVNSTASNVSVPSTLPSGKNCFLAGAGWRILSWWFQGSTRYNMKLWVFFQCHLPQTSSFLCLVIGSNHLHPALWTEEPGGLLSMGPQRVGWMHAHTVLDWSVVGWICGCRIHGYWGGDDCTMPL